MPQPQILVVRLGAMGDILHALPAVSRLKHSFPSHRLVWAVAPKWLPLLEGNPAVDEAVPFRRGYIHELFDSWRRLRAIRPEMAIDFQGLVQSALVGRAARPARFFGFSRAATREPLACLLYSQRVTPRETHVVDRNLELAAAAGATGHSIDFPLPAGRPEGSLPSGAFVLCHPFAGWVSKQWPLENYQTLASLLGLDGVSLVANVPPSRAPELAALPGVAVHSSSLLGLIDATRRADAVLGLDSGPLHLAAALGKNGVALYGPTCPARNGPYGGSIRVLRAPIARTSYKRRGEIDASLRAITVEQVYDALHAALTPRESRA